MPVPKDVVVAIRAWDEVNEEHLSYQIVRKAVVDIMMRDSGAHSAEDILCGLDGVRDPSGMCDIPSVHSVFRHSSSRLAKFLNSINGYVVRNVLGNYNVIRSIDLDGKDGQTTRYYYLDEKSDDDAAR